MKYLIFKICFLLLPVFAFSQGGSIKGRVYNPTNNQGIPFANVVVLGTDKGTVSDEDGRYEIVDVAPGLYNIRASFIGYRPKTIFEIQISRARAVQQDFELTEDASDLEEVVVSSEFSRSEDTPISLSLIHI